MNEEEMRQEYKGLYAYMAESKNLDNMKAFGKVMNEMMYWMIDNKPEAARNWIEKLESIKWKNYLTTKEAESIVSSMTPKAPWSRDQWKEAMTQYGFEKEKQPCYNSCALWVTMNMVMSDSSETIGKYVSRENLFGFVHDIAVDKLTDEDKRFNIRRYFGLLSADM